jgi:hypothetical protein
MSGAGRGVLREFSKQCEEGCGKKSVGQGMREEECSMGKKG